MIYIQQWLYEIEIYMSGEILGGEVGERWTFGWCHGGWVQALGRMRDTTDRETHKGRKKYLNLTQDF